jgi:hypothetical protein
MAEFCLVNTLMLQLYFFGKIVALALQSPAATSMTPLVALGVRVSLCTWLIFGQALLQLDLS